MIDSPFPMVHQNNYRQGYSLLPSLKEFDTIKVRTAETPRNRVSPWLQLSEAYTDGERVLLGSNSTHVWKAVSTEGRFEIVSEYQIDFNPAINDLSWSFLQLPGHQILTYDDNRLLKIADEDSSNPYSNLILLEEVNVPENIGTPSKLTRLYDGSIAFSSDIGVIGLLDDQLNILDTLRLDLVEGETSFHNDFASDEKGGIYTVTTKRMLRLQVTNQKKIIKDWEVFMDFGGNANQGVGTTPTLLGTDGDRLVCIVNSKEPAEMIVFWRDEIPSDWSGIPSEDLRLAARVQLPGSGPISSLYTSIENSPVAWGYGVACAQYNGFLGQDCDNRKGVYKLDWDPDNNKMNLTWYRDDINMNNVLMYSVPDNLIYGSGKEMDCNYYYYGIDWNTGATKLKYKLGQDTFFDDPGNANIILEDGSIVYNSKEKLVQIVPESKTLALNFGIDNLSNSIKIYPNPILHEVNISITAGFFSSIVIHNLHGEVLKSVSAEPGLTKHSISLDPLPAGIYFLSVITDKEFITSKVIKK